MVQTIIRFIIFLCLCVSTAHAEFQKKLLEDTQIERHLNKFEDGSPETFAVDSYLGQQSYGNMVPFSEYRVKYVNYGITGGVGAGSGVTYIPEVGLWLFDDNNTLVISIYRETDLTTEWGNWTLTNFNDPEWSEYMGMTYDANGKPENVILAIGEESCSVGQGCTAGSQEFAICTVPVNTATQAINKTGSACTRIQFTNAWTNDTTLGAEAGCYDPFRKIMWVFKQNTTMEVRAVPLDGTTTPAATEPWDASATLSVLPAINDCMFDKTSRTLLIIGDATGADDQNQDIVRVDPSTGTVIENYQSFVTTLGLNQDAASDWPQSEGLDCTPDMKYCMIGSETDNFALLQRVPPAAYYNDVTYLPADFVADDTSTPGITTVESTGTGTPRRQIMSYDAATDEFAYLTFIVPTDFRVTATPILLNISWYANSTTASQDAIWYAQISCTTVGDVDSMVEDAATALSAAMTVATNVNTTEANRLLTSQITLSTDDSLAAGDVCTLVLGRDADDSIGNADNDGLTVDANVVAVQLRFPRF